MSCRCDGNHEHQVLQGQTKVGGKWYNRTHVAQVYPRDMVYRIVKCAKLAVRGRESDVFAAEQLRRERSDRQLLESVRRCHVNLGHPAKERFLHMLKSANASEERCNLLRT